MDHWATNHPSSTVTKQEHKTLIDQCGPALTSGRAASCHSKGDVPVENEATMLKRKWL